MKIEQAALSLYQLLGSPLYALIQAETYAANATANFIREVGFEAAKSQTDGQHDFGKLRMLSFRQHRRTADGLPATYQVDVPLLSILPIPALQIKEAELEFYVKIVDMVTQERQERDNQVPYNTKAPEVEEFADDRLVPPPAPLHLDMKAMLGRGQSTASGLSSGMDMQVHIKIKVAQADPPAGLARLFNLMEQGISSTRVSPDEAPG